MDTKGINASKKRLKIVYLTPGVELFGGIKIFFHQANLLSDLGHAVSIVSPTEPPEWFPLRATYLQRPNLNPENLPAADVTVATFWTTIEHALAGAKGEIAHYCQGLEGTYTHNQDQHEAIHRAYAHRLPAMVVSAHLGDHLRKHYSRPSRLVPQPLEPWWTASSRWRPRRPARILVTSPFEIDWKGVKTSLKAVRLLKQKGHALRLIRLSQWPLTDEEIKILEPNEFHEHLDPHQVPELMRGCDLLMAASWEQEGFGLPVLEAMACGLPVVASDISSFRGFASSAATLVPHDQPAAFALAAEKILRKPRIWRQMRRRGRQIARSYREEASAQAAEAFMYWVASGEWRNEL